MLLSVCQSVFAPALIQLLVKSYSDKEFFQQVDLQQNPSNNHEKSYYY